jgi:glycosyltransferase involved in cell wall biosynthesis
MKVISITNLCLGYSATLPERSLYMGLSEKGIELIVITHYPTPESEELEKAGIRLVYMAIERKSDFRVIRSLRKIIKTERPDLLHLTFGKAITNAVIASRRTGCKIAAYLGSTSLHWYDPTAYLSFLSPAVDRLICLSDGIKEHVDRQAPLMMQNKTIRIYKGYETAWFSNVTPLSKESLGIQKDDFIIGCIANVRKLKGIPYLIESAGLLPPNLPLKFMLVGPGMDSDFIRKLIEETKVPAKFITMGFTNEVLSYTALCDVYVQPSITEGLGRSVIEAMSLSKPVIASGSGGVGELIEEGITGYHIRSKSPELLAEKILRCYENRNTLHMMGDSARRRIETKFNSEQMTGETYSLFKSMLSLR